MEQMDTLYEILEQSAKLYEDFIKIEYAKYDAITRDDLRRLDDIISEEQVFYLKSKGFEQKREKITQSMNMKDKTFKEIIEFADKEQEYKLKLVYDRLYKVLINFKEINSECKTLIEIRLHKIGISMNNLGQKQYTYTDGENQKTNLKSQIVSKKI